MIEHIRSHKADMVEYRKSPNPLQAYGCLKEWYSFFFLNNTWNLFYIRFSKNYLGLLPAWESALQCRISQSADIYQSTCIRSLAPSCTIRNIAIWLQLKLKSVGMCRKLSNLYFCFKLACSTAALVGIHKSNTFCSQTLKTQVIL